MRYFDNTYTEGSLVTMGVAQKNKIVTLNEKRVKLQIFDTAGQERFRTLTTGYYKAADCVFLVYDCSDEESFDCVANWVQQIEVHANENIMRILIANKVDLPADKRKITREQGEQVAQQFGFTYMETSAKAGLGVKEMFENSAIEMAQKQKELIKESVSDNNAGEK